MRRQLLLWAPAIPPRQCKDCVLLRLQFCWNSSPKLRCNCAAVFYVNDLRSTCLTAGDLSAHEKAASSLGPSDASPAVQKTVPLRLLYHSRFQVNLRCTVTVICYVSYLSSICLTAGDSSAHEKAASSLGSGGASGSRAKLVPLRLYLRQAREAESPVGKWDEVAFTTRCADAIDAENGKIPRSFGR